MQSLEVALYLFTPDFGIEAREPEMSTESASLDRCQNRLNGHDVIVKPDLDSADRKGGDN